MKKTNQVQNVVAEVMDAYEVLNKLWGYSAQEIMDYLRNKGVQLEFSILGYRGGFDRRAWYMFIETFPKEAWLDNITLKPKFRGMNYATGRKTRYTESELMGAEPMIDYKRVWQLKAKYKNKKEIFKTEYQNYSYVLSCECIAWLKRIDPKFIDKLN